MKKPMIAITALLAVAFLATNAFSWGHGGSGRGCSNGYGAKGNSAYNQLTAEQKTQLNTLRQQFVDETYETRSAMMTKHQELRMLLETSSPDKAKLDTLITEVSDLKKGFQIKRVDFILAAKKIAPELNMSGFGKGQGFGRGNNRGCKGSGNGQNCSGGQNYRQ